MEIHGFCEERFQPLKDSFRANFDAGLELGASLALTHRGKMVVDIWGGYTDRNETRPWQKDTIVNVFSATKIMATISALMLVDRGLIDLDAPIARYWPEFSQRGKAAITVRDAFTHQAGVPGFDLPVSFEALHDWDGITAHIAAGPHWFDGRKVLIYHPVTFGFLLGELIRRVDGRKPAQFFREEIASKVGADFQIGLSSKSDVSRVAELRFPADPLPLPKGSLTEKVFTSVGPGDWTSWERLSADIPAASGIGNGRSIAQVCAIVALGGEYKGTRYLSKKMTELAAEEQVYDQDPAFGWLRMGLGFGLHSEQFPAPTPTSFHWGGYGGSWGLMDPKIGVSLGYAPNNMIVDIDTLDPRLKRFSTALETLAPEL
jgi:CubicO group peptidase (beta-lactamase class C family)